MESMKMVKMVMVMKMMKTVKMMKMMKMMKTVPLGMPQCVVGQNPLASSDRQHEEPRGSRDCWWAPGRPSTARDPAHVLASGLLGVPPDLVPDQEGVMR
jgi:hypothetical protein